MSVPQPNLIWVPSPNYTEGRQGNSVQNITFHHACSSAESAVSWLANTASQVSAHFVVAPDKIYCMVDTDNTAWTNGNWASNLISVTIEHAGTWLNGFRDEGVIAQSVILNAWLIDLYPNATPNRHRDVCATECPGDFPVEEVWQKAQALRQSIINPAPAPAPVVVVPEWLKNRVPQVCTKYIAKDGVQLLDLTTLKAADARVFTQNMKIDVGSKTTVSGKDYFITVYSTGKNIAAGYLGTDLLDQPYSPPIPEPEVINPPVVDPEASQDVTSVTPEPVKHDWITTFILWLISLFKKGK